MADSIPAKTVKRYPNSRPWMTHQIQLMLKEKKQAFQRKDWLSLRDINRSVKNEIKKAKLAYKDKLEQDFSSMNTKQAFQKVRTLTGSTPKTCTSPTDPISFTTDLNNFFARFDTTDYSAECERLLRNLPAPEQPYSVPFTERDVYHLLRSCKTGKAREDLCPGAGTHHLLPVQRIIPDRHSHPLENIHRHPCSQETPPL